MFNFSFWQRLSMWSLLLAALVLYVLTLDNGLQPEELRGGDLITHQYAQVQARPGNAPGYPLYTMGGWLWFHTVRGVIRSWGNPLPNPIPILSGYSLLWALISLWLFYKIVSAVYCLQTRTNPKRAQESLLSHDHLIIWLLCAFYACTYFFWFYATTTEQYTSAVAQTLAIVYFYLRLRRDEQPINRKGNDGGTPNRATIYGVLGLAFLCGLSLAHMLTVTFIVPPLVVVLLWDFPWLLRQSRMVVAAVVAAAVPLVSYVYVYMRGKAHPEWWGDGEWRSANEWFWAFISTAQGRDELARGFESWCGPLAGGFPAGIWHELSLPFLILGLVGIALLDRKLAALLYGTLGIYFVFCWLYRCGNWFQVILPAYPLILLGLVPLIRLYLSRAAHENSPGGRWLRLLPAIVLVVALLWRIDSSWPQVNSRNRAADQALPAVAHLLSDSIPPGTALFAQLDEALALNYLNQIWGIRPDLEITDHKEARRRIDNGQFVLTTYASAPQLLAEMRPETAMGMWSFTADWIALQDVDAIDEDSYGEPDVLVEQFIEEGVELVGYRLAEGPTKEPVTELRTYPLDVTLFWRVSGSSWPDGLSISVRPTIGGAFLPLSTVDSLAPPDAIIQQDADRPMQGLYPISRIPPGQTFPDPYRILLPSAEAADNVALILYRPHEDGFTNVAEIRLPIY